MFTMKLVEKEISITAPWGKLAALTWGEQSNPPVLLCHGRQDVCSGFRPLLSLLPSTFFYVSIELPGNGKSDHFPKFSRYTIADYVPSIEVVQKHFNWEKFIFIGHSLGGVIGKYFDLAYPGVISRMVELDPTPAYDVWTPNHFNAWYHKFYGDFYRADKYMKHNASWETAPKYTYEKAAELMMNVRGLTIESAKHVLENRCEVSRKTSSTQPSEISIGRCVVTNIDSLGLNAAVHRFTYDQRQKDLPRLPLSPDYVKQLYPSTKTPILCFLAKDMVEIGMYYYAPFVFDEKDWPNKNYRVKIVEGGHDNHINNPEVIAKDISDFLLEDLKVRSKL